jgi:hypothetical protein
MTSRNFASSPALSGVSGACVTAWGTFAAKTNPSGVRARQFSTCFGSGVP